MAAGSFCLAFDAGGPALGLYSWCSRIGHPLFTYGDQGLFLRRSTFEWIGGFAPIPLLEDVEIQARLRARGRFVKVRVPVVISARRFQARGAVRQQVIDALLVLAFRAGADPAALARLYAGGDAPAALAAKILFRRMPKDQAARDQWTKHRAFCSWCLLSAAATFAVLPLVWSEAREALRELEGR